MKTPFVLLTGLALLACAAPPRPAPATPADAFFAALRARCGQAFEGRIVANEPAPAASDAFAGRPLVMHVHECGATRLRIPFHVGEDRSRTWVLTRTASGLQLQHDHRHADGRPDAVTMYGGHTRDPGLASRQRFPVDARTVQLFEREGLTASVTNVWTLQIDAASFAYELTRPGRVFRVEFDLARPVPVPPLPWGQEAR